MVAVQVTDRVDQDDPDRRLQRVALADPEASSLLLIEAPE
jgi:hypothetical protein